MTDLLGPWSVSGVRARTRLGRETVLRIINSKDEVNVFVLYGDGSNEQHHQAYAEANLIAAAPDMLGALDMLVNNPELADIPKIKALLQLLDVPDVPWNSKGPKLDVRKRP